MSRYPGGVFHSLSKAAGLAQLLCLTVNNVTSLPLQMLQVPGILQFLGSLLCPSFYKQPLLSLLQLPLSWGVCFLPGGM